jgi:hypothetical protein
MKKCGVTAALAAVAPATMLRARPEKKRDAVYTPPNIHYGYKAKISFQNVLYAGEDIHAGNFLFVGDDNKVYNAILTNKPIIAHDLGKANQHFEAEYEIIKTDIN